MRFLHGAVANSSAPHEAKKTYRDSAKLFEGHHPELNNICVINCANLQRLVPNHEAVDISNECFDGECFLMIRTPDVDDASHPKPTHHGAKRISHYFKGRQRRFEFQFRVKLKRVPTGPLFLGCEVEHAIQMGRFTKGLSSVLLAMIRRINSGFHYSWGLDENNSNSNNKNGKNTPPPADGTYEKTHLSFPVEASMDRIVITKPGETPPPLGYELIESDQSVRRRRKMGAGSVDWNLEDTYTMCLWSAYVDWIMWKSLNVVGVRPFHLTSVTGTQPIYLSVYELQGITPKEYAHKKKKPPHYRKNLSVYTRLELSNPNKTIGGIVGMLNATDETSADAHTNTTDTTNSSANSSTSTSTSTTTTTTTNNGGIASA